MQQLVSTYPVPDVEANAREIGIVGIWPHILSAIDHCYSTA